MIYADIIVDISHEKLDRSFQYRVPKELEAEIQLGMVVTIPFGNGNHERKGYVTGLSDKPAFDISKMKELHGICSSEETTEKRLIALAAWMKNRYGSTMVQALKTVLPVREKVKAKEKRYIVLNMDVAAGERRCNDRIFLCVRQHEGSGRAAGSGTGEWQMQSQGKTGSGASEREETGLYKSVQRTWDDSICYKAAGGSGCSAGDTG